MGILWVGFQWLQTIKSTVRGLENTEKRLDKDHLLIGELSIPTMYMAISNKMYAI